MIQQYGVGIECNYMYDIKFVMNFVICQNGYIIFYCICNSRQCMGGREYIVQLVVIVVRNYNFISIKMYCIVCIFWIEDFFDYYWVILEIVDLFKVFL